MSDDCSRLSRRLLHPANPSHRVTELLRAPSCRPVVAAAAATGDQWSADHHQYHGGRRAGAEELAAPSVQCDVDVVSWRERRVLASVAVAADVDTLWQVITDYERLADFIPNLVHRSAFLTSRSRCCWLPHLRILVRGLRCLRSVIVVIRSHLIVFLRILERRPVYFSCILAQRNKHNFITSLILTCLELLVSTMDFFSSSLTYHQH
jgi:hypothetical protein